MILIVPRQNTAPRSSTSPVSPFIMPDHYSHVDAAGFEDNGILEGYAYEPVPMGRSNSDSSTTTYATDTTYWHQSEFGSYDDNGTEPSAQSSWPTDQTYQTMHPSDLFSQTIGHIDSTAFEYSSSALSYLATADGDQLRQMYEAGMDLPAIFITSKAIAKKVEKSHRWDEEGEREAALDILVDLLSKAFTTDSGILANVHMILHEAASHILLRVVGPENLEICHFSICMALKSVEEKLLGSGTREKEQAAETSRRTSRSSRSASEKGKWICDYSTCQSKSFSRYADLARHKSSVHLEEENGEAFYCDYKKCSRNKQPFFRQDHFRDHLRDQHKEDLLRRGSKSDRDWWNSRNKHALFDGWWRCNKCMSRVSDDEWVCDRCGNACETERRQYRTTGTTR